ncbi:MAG TPA: heme exporter protein CcmB [Patescibacteria group bacterium]|nr:heme exporter protein CcmB [Patescibacteria group bacterium]
MVVLQRIFAVFLKDLKSELRTRYALTAVFLFVLTTIAIVLFSTRDEHLTKGFAAGILWIIMFFSAMTGLAKSFVSEEERGTAFLLQLTTTSTAVYFGKLLFNCILNVLLNITAVLLFFFFLNVTVAAPGLFVLAILLGSFGIACAVTVISAIIAKANTKGALLPVLSFPLLLPLLIPGIETTFLALTGAKFSDVQGDFQMMGSYCVVVTTISYLLFDFVWKE